MVAQIAATVEPCRGTGSGAAMIPLRFGGLTGRDAGANIAGTSQEGDLLHVVTSDEITPRRAALGIAF